MYLALNNLQWLMCHKTKPKCVNKKLFLCLAELFEIEMFKCIKMDLALNNQSTPQKYLSKVGDSSRG